MAGKTVTTTEILTLLAAAPEQIATFTAGLTPAQLQAPPAEDEWSFVVILAHLRACADVWGGCIDQILAEERPTIRAVNPMTWIVQTNYSELPFSTSLAAFTAQRHALLATLTGLAPADWLRTATVTGAGKPLERSVQSYAEWLATHERSHVKHIRRLAARLAGEEK